MLEAVKSLMASRKTILMISGVIVGFAAKYGIQLSDGAVAAILMPIVAQILGIAIEGPAPVEPGK